MPIKTPKELFVMRPYRNFDLRETCGSDHGVPQIAQGQQREIVTNLQRKVASPGGLSRDI